MTLCLKLRVRGAVSSSSVAKHEIISLIPCSVVLQLLKMFESVHEKEKFEYEMSMKNA